MSENKTGGGLGFGAILALIFITLKLCGVIGWSWWWVLSPLWIGFLIGVVICLFLISAAVFKELRKERR